MHAVYYKYKLKSSYIKNIRWRVVTPHNQRFKKSEKLAQREKKSIDVRFLVSKVYLFGVRMFHENS